MSGRGSSRSGQVLPVAFVAVLALLFAALWLAGVSRAVRVRDRTQNAGDAAAMACARWLGITLNMEGNLNLAHAVALAAGDDAAVDAITNVQLRALFSGPLVGVAAAQQAAKLNGAPVNREFTDFVREHASLVRNGYGGELRDGSIAMREPWPGAWGDYAAMISALADDGIAAGIDNAVFYDDPSGAHWLLSFDFYDAVLGRSWCWFRQYAPSLLSDYTGFSWWPPLPEAPAAPPFSAELPPLYLHPSLCLLNDLLQSPYFMAAADEAGVSSELPRAHSREAERAPPQPWILFDREAWGEWTAMKDPSLPLAGRLRARYDVAGADAAFRVENRIAGSGGGAAATLSWTAAAKPLGAIRSDASQAAATERVSASPVVLPAWREVRLIPLDASSAPSGGSFNLQWREHCKTHLRPYLRRGVAALEEDCRWCEALRIWEGPDFRRSGSRWLSTNAWQCVLDPPGNTRDGGSRHAH